MREKMVAKVGRYGGKGGIGLIGMVGWGGGAAGEERNFKDSVGLLRVVRGVRSRRVEDSIVEVSAKKR